MKNGKTGLSRLIAATGYSRRGFVSAFRHEEAFRQELALVVVGLVLAIVVAGSAVEFLLLAIPLLLILLAELLNSAIEAAVDRFGGERHELSGRAKDLGSAAVFISLCIAALSWGVLLAERFF